MTMITVRPIGSDEIDDFIAIGNDSFHGDDVKQYLEQMVVKGSIRSKWCFVVEEADQLRGRLAYWTLPKLEKPLDIVLLELPWESEHYLSLGTYLLRETLTTMRGMGVEDIGYVLDIPALAPQWQRFSEQRIRLLDHIGFNLKRETYRFEWKAQDAYLSVSQGLIFRSLSEVGDTAFIEAIQRVSENSLDRRIQHDREHNGPEVQARNMFRDLQLMEYDPDWWQLAYTLHGELVGFVMPTKSPTTGTIGYIGVVPEQRGRGYIDTLLNQATVILHEAGANVIRADTDVSNTPMADAFKRAGYIQFARRREYSLKLNTYL